MPCATSRCTVATMTTWLAGGLQEAADDGGGGVVGEVGNHLVRPARRDDRVERDGEGVGVDDADVEAVREALPQRLAQGGVDLQRDDAPGAAGEDVRERAEAGADLHDGVGGADLGGVGDALEDGGRDEEVLAEPLAGLQAKTAERAAGGGGRRGSTRSPFDKLRANGRADG